MLWDTNKDLSNELNTKEEIISSKDVEIRGLRAKVTTLTEEVNGLKYRLTLIDENAVERLRNAKNAPVVLTRLKANWIRFGQLIRTY